MSLWEKKNQAQISKRIFQALSENVNYYEENILGVRKVLDKRRHGGP